MKTLDPETRALLTAPFADARGPVPLGRAVWLYLACVLAANDQGLVICTVERFSRDLGVPESAIEAWVKRLADAKLVVILSSAPYLTVRLPFWSARSFPVAETAMLSAEKTDSSYSKQSSGAISFPGNSGDRGPGEGDLRAGLRSVLPDADAAEIDRILTRYPHGILRKTLDRVGKAGRIRKSKTALFRFLLARFSQEIDVRDL